jgi:hypothetical protein
VDIKHSFITLAKVEGLTFFSFPFFSPKENETVGELKRRETNSPSGTKKAKREERKKQKRFFSSKGRK